MINFFIRISYLIFLYSNSNAQTVEGTFESPFKRYEIGEAFTGTPSQTWSTCVWKGERIHQQILLWADADISGLTYEISDLTSANSSISSDHIQLRFEQYIKGDPEARSCGEYAFHGVLRQIADGLSDEAVHEINANDPLKTWLTIEVPCETPAGFYNGNLIVTTPTQTLEFFLHLEVLNYQLPNVADQRFHLDLWQFPAQVLSHYNNANPNNTISVWSDAHFALFSEAYQYLGQIGQKSITTHIKENALGSPSMIRWIKTTSGEWEYDFSAFVKYVDSLSAWGIHKQISCSSLVGWNKDVIPFWDEGPQTMINLDAPLGSPVFKERWTNFLNHFKPLLQDKGWFEKTVLYMDEVPASEMIPVIDLILGHDENWKIGLAHGHELSSSITDDIYDLSGILNVGTSEGREDLQTTFYTSCTQVRPNNYVSLENSPAEMVWMGWHAARENFDGYLRWAFDYWQLADPFDSRDGSNTAGDFSMGYRSSNNADLGFISSTRLEMLHSGIQDFEKIRILKDSLFIIGNTEALDILTSKVNEFIPSNGSDLTALVGNARGMLQNLLCETTVSMNSLPKSPLFKIFPNPVKDTLQIEAPSRWSVSNIKIIDSKGSLIKHYDFAPITSLMTLNIVDLRIGTYFLIIETENGTYEHSIIKI